MSTIQPKFIGIGSSGCVVSNALKCKRREGGVSDDPVIPPGMDVVTKMMSYESGEDEYDIFNKLKNSKAADLDDVLIRPISMCKPEINDPNFNLSLQTCSSEYMRRYGESVDDLREYVHGMHSGIIQISENGGPDLQEFLIHSAHDMHSDELWDFLFALQNLFKGLTVFRENKIMHRDIKLPNISYNPQKKQIKFIDIGLMIPDTDELLLECIEQRFDELGSCSYFPPEVYLWNRRVWIKSFINTDSVYAKFLGVSFESFDVFCTANVIQSIYEGLLNQRNKSTGEYILNVNGDRSIMLSDMVALCELYTIADLNKRHTTIQRFSEKYNLLITKYRV
jgi:serine/threonine protein kinase